MKIGITNLKGGVGKTTLSVNLAVCFAHMDYRVCVLDTDTNQNSMQWSGAREGKEPSVLVVGSTNPRALNSQVAQLHSSHDIIILDGTPNLSEMNTRVIMVSDILLIPIRPGANDLRTLTEFFSRVEMAESTLGRHIPAYFVINEFDERLNLHKTVKESLKENFATPILRTVLKSRTAYGEANLMGSGVYEHSDDKAKDEMVALTREILAIAETYTLIL